MISLDLKNSKKHKGYRIVLSQVVPLFCHTPFILSSRSGVMGRRGRLLPLVLAWRDFMTFSTCSRRAMLDPHIPPLHASDGWLISDIKLYYDTARPLPGSLQIDIAGALRLVMAETHVLLQTPSIFSWPSCKSFWSTPLNRGENSVPQCCPASECHFHHHQRNQLLLFIVIIHFRRFRCFSLPVRCMITEMSA